MTKNRHFIRQKLSTQLVVVLTVAIALAYISFPLLTRLSYRLLEATLLSPEAIAQDETRYIWMLQEFLVDGNIIVSDLTPLNEWLSAEKNIKLTLFNNNLIFDSDYENLIYNDANPANGDENIIAAYSDYLDKQYISALIKEYNSNFYTLTFADGTVVNALIRSESYSAYYLWAYYLCLFLSLLIFILTFLILVSGKLRYLRTLSRELKILENGDLNYEMTAKGFDELSELAHGINQLRLSLLAQKKEEEKTTEEHQKLMTALAHDLRTPLSSLIDYLELLLLKRYRDEDQLRKLLLTSERKAFQLREMSNKLFEYFLTAEKTAATYSKDVVETRTLIESLIDNQLFDLENNGFMVKLYAEPANFKGVCLIDAEFFKRVLDNTAANIYKFADREKTVDVLSFETETFLHIEFVNALNPEARSGERAALGLITCAKIMREHGGNYQGYEQGGKFISRMILPLHKTAE